MTERVHIHDTATHGKLSGLIDIVHLLESELSHHLLQHDIIMCLAYLQTDRTLIEFLLGNHQLGNCLWVRDDI